MKLILIAVKYLKRYPLLTAAVLISIMLVSLLEGASFGMLIPLIQSMVAGPGGLIGKISFIGNFGLLFSHMGQLQAISFIFITIFFISLVKNVFGYISDILIAKLRFGVVKDLRSGLMDNLVEYDIKYFDSIKTGYLISNIDAETMRMGDFFMAVLQLLALLSRVLVYIVLLVLISWKASIFILILIASVLLPIEFIMKKVKKIGADISQAIADYNYKLTEILNGIRLIKGCGTEQKEKNDFKSAVERLYNLFYRSKRYAGLIIPLSETCIVGLLILCFLITINLVRTDIANIFPFIATYMLVLTRTLTQLNSLNNRRSDALMNLAAFTSYERAYDAQGKQTIKSGSIVLKDFTDSIEFRNVNFSYVDGKHVLDGINIKIPYGKITAVVGASGAGKSTLINLILRFYDATSGKILVDGIELKELALRQWRVMVGLVSQDTFIFNTSVRDNISYGRADITEDDMVRAAKAASAHNFIANLPAKYDTMLGERGVRLSGGERQRISIARAIIHNPKILILDEATSALDTETERLIRGAIDMLTKSRTVIAIAHRLSTILHADNIIVIDNGRIAETGRHIDLIENGGVYKRLYDGQFITQAKGIE